jgi:4-oxalomesaconate tautomerase
VRPGTEPRVDLDFLFAQLEGSVCAGVAKMPKGSKKAISVEHPTGEFSVELETDPANPQNVIRAAPVRTARLIMHGEAMAPASISDGRR